MASNNNLVHKYPLFPWGFIHIPFFLSTVYYGPTEPLNTYDIFLDINVLDEDSNFNVMPNSITPQQQPDARVFY